MDLEACLRRMLVARQAQAAAAERCAAASEQLAAVGVRAQELNSNEALPKEPCHCELHKCSLGFTGCSNCSGNWQSGNEHTVLVISAVPGRSVSSFLGRVQALQTRERAQEQEAQVNAAREATALHDVAAQKASQRCGHVKYAAALSSQIMLAQATALLDAAYQLQVLPRLWPLLLACDVVRCKKACMCGVHLVHIFKDFTVTLVLDMECHQ